MIPQTNRANNLRRAQEDLAKPMVKQSNSQGHPPLTNFINSSSTNFQTKKIKRVDKRALLEEGSSVQGPAKPAAPKAGPAQKKPNYRESLMSLDRQFLENPLSVARYCQQIFDFYIEQEV